MIKGIVFDLDGVITNTAKLHFQAWQKMALKLNLELDWNVEPFLRGVSRNKCLELILNLKNDRKNLQLSVEEKAQLLLYKNEVYVKSLNQINETNLLPNISKILNYLKNHHYKIALASVSQNAPLILQKLKIEHYFNYLVDINTISFLKPNPEIFYNAIKGLKLQTWEVLIVDDSTIGMNACKQGNLTSIGIGVQGNYTFTSSNQFSVEALEKIIGEENEK